MPGKRLALFALLFVVIGCGTTPTRTPDHAVTVTAFQKPQVKKVVLVVLENGNPDEARGQAFLGHLADTGAYLSNYYGVAHPSQPNYVALISGSVAGVSGDNPARLSRLHLGQKLTSWMSFAQGYPKDSCDLRETIGRYARKHEPFLSFKDVQDDKQLCREHITDFSAFLAAAKDHKLPDFSLVIPDLDHDGHDKPLRDADTWLAKNFTTLLNDPLFKQDVLLIVTFDENDDKFPYVRKNPNRVYAVLWGDSVIPGKVVDAPYDHYDLLRTIEAIFDVSPMSTQDSKARPIDGIWRY